VDGAELGAELNDGQLAEEITLLGEVMSAATAVGAVMTQAQIDAALGLYTFPQGRRTTREERRRAGHTR
jgi:hypothetical protein